MKDQVQKLFREDKQAYFDFSQAPTLIRRKEEDTQETSSFEEKDLSQWRKGQQSFLRWTEDDKIFTEEYIANGKETYAAFFNERGYLLGSVLDIGGGWGLFRQWWKSTASDIFVVHDPGVDRFLHGPHKLHHDYYERALSLPMIFVEGFGEELPYEAGIFDTCLIASALDHCIDPQRVFAETYRCLKPGGIILVIQHCDLPGARPHVLKRIIKHLGHPNRLFSILYERLFYDIPHLHHFLSQDIILLLERTGFSKIDACVIPNTQNVYAFEART